MEWAGHLPARAMGSNVRWRYCYSCHSLLSILPDVCGSMVCSYASIPTSNRYLASTLCILSDPDWSNTFPWNYANPLVSVLGCPLWAELGVGVLLYRGGLRLRPAVCSNYAQVLVRWRETTFYALRAPVTVGARPEVAARYFSLLRPSCPRGSSCRADLDLRTQWICSAFSRRMAPLGGKTSWGRLAAIAARFGPGALVSAGVSDLLAGTAWRYAVEVGVHGRFFFRQDEAEPPPQPPVA